MGTLQEPTLKNLYNTNFGEPPEKHNELLELLGKPHITSFNYMLEEGLDQAVADLYPIEFTILNDTKIKLKISEAIIGYPQVPVGTIGVKNTRVYPTECRQRAYTYKARMTINVEWWIDDKRQPSFQKDMGEVPIMIKSSHCHLSNMSPADLVKHGEHSDEWGGYFIVKGHERLVRMLLMTRRNYPVAIKRSGWKSRGTLFSDVGVQIRCVQQDQTATNNVLHFLTDGSAKFMFSHRKVLYYVPLMLMLKCFCDYGDQYIYQRLMQGYEDDMYFSGRIQNMMRLMHEENLHNQDDCKKYLGAMFRVRFYEIRDSCTDEEITEFILKRCALIHLDSPEDKFNLLIFMTQKLFVFAKDGCKVEGADSIMMQEVLLGGHLYLQILKERMQNWLSILKSNLIKRSTSRANVSLSSYEIAYAAKMSGGFEASMENFLSTGNVSTNSGLGLMQDKGLTIVAENINRMRFMSHFRAVHRGAFFQEMRTTEVRQLLPDAWGFICPVHTPDGTPCGLLNHLTINCQVTDVPDKNLLANIPKVLTNLGMLPLTSTQNHNLQETYTVMLDGKILGHVQKNIAGRLVDKLRIKKIKSEVPPTLEIVLVPIKKFQSQFPGLFLFTGPARMMRPLKNLAANAIELVGTFEQVYMDVCVSLDECIEGVTTHCELSKTAFMSNLAHLIPMPDCNQSPRNMYQCQMGKQTMGTPLHTWTTQAETKMYRLQMPSSPLFRPVHHDNIGLDNYAMGTNAIVAVISYTGYDMEDAMIINKSAYERGFAHGCIYKTEFIELKHVESYFCRNPQLEDLVTKLDTDGLPHPGTLLKYGDPLYCYYNSDESKYYVVKFAGKEEAYVDNVRICGSFNAKQPKVACIVFRIPRNPSVGDKFASRAGQKGICSQKWPAEDLPFTETGLVPDIVFNPHGFPSRMTIAMMIEVMAGKSAALHGLVHDATPFKFNEEDTAIDYFGKLLEAGGYNYYGTETMYSGIDGREMDVQIFFGVVHYQRLRHMVSDKWQVRSTGPIDTLTRQPLKGRKKGGGIRFGEMERDSLISHGASFLLQDRLFHCSDKCTSLICTSCGTILGPINMVTRISDKAHLTETKEMCRLCGHGDNVSKIEIPYIFRFLVTQLASVNINVKINCKKV